MKVVLGSWTVPRQPRTAHIPMAEEGKLAMDNNDDHGMRQANA